MKQNPKLLFWMLTSILLLSACDVPGFLQVKNKSGEKITYITYQNTSDRGIEKDILEIEDGETRGRMFGFGSFWTKEGIEEYLSNIEKIEIITNTDTLVFNDKQQLFYYFKKRRRGIFNNAMKIKVKKVNQQMFEK